jgi:hypothetical protein
MDTAQHGRRERACGLTDRDRLLPTITRSSTKLSSDAYQSQMQVASVKPNTVCRGQGKVVAAHYKNEDLLHCGLAVRIFPATMRTFTKDTALSEQDRGAVWHVWITARSGRGTAWAWHGNGVLCVTRPLRYDNIAFINCCETHVRLLPLHAGSSVRIRDYQHILCLPNTSQQEREFPISNLNFMQQITGRPHFF